MVLDPETGKWKAKEEYDASDPFATIEDRIVEMEVRAFL